MKVAESTEAHPLSGKLTFRHAGSLTPMCAEIHKEFKLLHTNLEIVDVGGGAVRMARDLAEGMECDVYASVDYSNIPNLLIPDFADWYIIFASTGFVLRYTDKSKYADEITAANWLDIIQRDDVTLWRGDPGADPAAYRTLMVFQLAEKFYGIPGLCEKLAAKSGKRFLSAAMLGERDKGYSFSYSSHLGGAKSISLPDQINLSNAAFADYYRQASVTIPSLRPGKTVTMPGEPIRLGITITKACNNLEPAIAWTSLLLGHKGKALMEQVGKRPITPVFGGDLTKIPKALFQ